MNRVLDQPTDIRTAADRQVLDRFLPACDDPDQGRRAEEAVTAVTGT